MIAGASKFSPGTLAYQISPYAQSLIDKAYEGLEMPADYHVHLLGIDNTRETYIHPSFRDIFHPIKRVKYEIFMHAAQVENYGISLNEYIDRLLDLISHMPRTKIHAFAFDTYHDKAGKADLTKTDFFISNHVVAALAKKHPESIVPVISVHPNRKDALDVLKKYHEDGVKFVKWLPNAMNIDPMDPSITPYYQALKKYKMALIVHVGDEHAVTSNNQSYGNPLNYKMALDLGVKIIMAHAATLGECEDIESATLDDKPCFKLFMRMMDTPKYQDLLFADLSSIYLSNRNMDFVKTLLAREDLHSRLLNGSDYPLVAINIMVNLRHFTDAGLLNNKQVKGLKEIYAYNPLLFDFVLKRTLRHPDKRVKFSPIIFEQRELY